MSNAKVAVLESNKNFICCLSYSADHFGYCHTAILGFMITLGEKLVKKIQNKEIARSNQPS